MAHFPDVSPGWRLGGNLPTRSSSTTSREGRSWTRTRKAILARKKVPSRVKSRGHVFCSCCIIRGIYHELLLIKVEQSFGVSELVETLPRLYLLNLTVTKDKLPIRIRGNLDFRRYRLKHPPYFLRLVSRHQLPLAVLLWRLSKEDHLISLLLILLCAIQIPFSRSQLQLKLIKL
jgi:hypothetical protein